MAGIRSTWLMPDTGHLGLGKHVDHCPWCRRLVLAIDSCGPRHDDRSVALGCSRALAELSGSEELSIVSNILFLHREEFG